MWEVAIVVVDGAAVRRLVAAVAIAVVVAVVVLLVLTLALGFMVFWWTLWCRWWMDQMRPKVSIIHNTSHPLTYSRSQILWHTLSSLMYSSLNSPSHVDLSVPIHQSHFTLSLSLSLSSDSISRLQCSHHWMHRQYLRWRSTAIQRQRMSPGPRETLRFSIVSFVHDRWHYS